ncbi:Ferritin [uncultured delta proteobacterium]|uniref:Ferritin n=1 Tax=uncultured delta proteobacterium TaxID=34034 RepID=A0A212KFD7_9DELT|nr:Ferritin [uncultured delta proteobacterium]
MNAKMTAAFNEQIKNEFYSAYMYLSMSAYFAEAGMPGFATWMRVQAKEEVTHATKMYDFVLSRGGMIELKAIDAPPASWKTPLAAFEAGLTHEKFVTGAINNLTDLAVKEKDHASQIFLSWFVTEQVEEEQSFGDILNALKLIKGEGQGLLMMDRELGARVFVDPTQAAGA